MVNNFIQNGNSLRRIRKNLVSKISSKLVSSMAYHWIKYNEILWTFEIALIHLLFRQL
jgi:hypothetical protein